MVDVAVASGAAWVCPAQGRHLVDVVLPVHVGNKDDHEEELGQSEADETNGGGPVLLEQTEEGSPCVLTLQCSPSSHTAISRLLVISEARTMEVYSQMGEYCGTLLSLAGRSSVLVCRVVVGLQQLQPCLARGPGIDMQQVQCLVEEMGTSLSPGAQNLMDMVHFQQKNQTGSLGGFLPLLMGSGALSALAQGAMMSPAAISRQPQPADSRPPFGSVTPADEAPPAQNGAMSNGSASSSPDKNISKAHHHNRALLFSLELHKPQQLTSLRCGLISLASSESRGLVSHAQLAEMMSHFLNGRQGNDQSLSSGPEFLPMLQSVCGQVTKLRLDDATALAENEKKMRNGTWELDSAMERRLEEMERRLKEHVDRRLDALEQKLEKALLAALPQFALNQGVTSSSAGEAAAMGLSEQTAPTAAIQ
ncbi:protein C10orf88-like protein [Nibea albiflora]|uniref:Protein C10orf88-like protein n=1 Tax=Nibea albiflora TaxID=240163 RepID=A0ACB7F3M1_NIBAL|nr:protein C10orf88-like protein [Nibea albiflora]